MLQNRSIKLGHEPYMKQPPFIDIVKGNDLSIYNKYGSVAWVYLICRLKFW